MEIVNRVLVLLETLVSFMMPMPRRAASHSSLELFRLGKLLLCTRRKLP
jgi:hypothetical protein